MSIVNALLRTIWTKQTSFSPLIYTLIVVYMAAMKSNKAINAFFQTNCTYRHSLNVQLQISGNGKQKRMYA